MLVGSAPCFPYGVIDPIEELSELALARGVWLHVDACVGGYFAPFARMNGVPVPPFDFEVPGVRSISADLHKYGYAAKGASTVFHRTEAQWQHQIFTFDDWPAGGMVTPTVAGTRPGGAIASAWAVLHYLGVEGYREKARQVVATREKLMARDRRDGRALHPRRAAARPLHLRRDGARSVRDLGAHDEARLVQRTLHRAARHPPDAVAGARGRRGPVPRRSRREPARSARQRRERQET